ncbi:MAG: sensor histidine kinase, partial [Thermomicrobiales bacterium]
QIIVDAPEPVVGRYDRMRVTQLLENLVENAIKYSPDGGEVRIRVWGDNDQATLTVRDPGIGIPAADLPHLFERFHRGTNVDDRQFAGMGLGLYICRSIVEEHGGEIHASSKPGQGSTFQVTLPRQFAPDAAPEQEAVSVQLGTEHHR